VGPPYLTNEQWWALPREEREERQRALPPEFAKQPAADPFTFYEAQQPPLYYWMFSAPLRLAGSWHLWPRVLMLRLLSMALASVAIPLPWLAAGETLGFWCAALIAVAPGFALDVCRVANDSLANRADFPEAYLLAIVQALLLCRRSLYGAAPALLIAGWWYLRNIMLGLPFTGWIQHAGLAQALGAVFQIHWLSTMQVIANSSSGLERGAS